MFRVGAIALWLPLVSVLPVRAEDALPSVDEIVKKSIDARGGLDKIKAIKSVKISGKAVINGGQMEAPLTLQVKRPNSMRMEMSLQGKSIVQAFDGSTSWMVNPFMGSDDPQKSSEEDTKEAMDDADMDGALVDYKAKGHTIELVGKDDVEGSPAYKLKITKKNGSVQYDYIDVQNFMEVKSTSKRRQMGQEFEVDSFPSNYKPVAGVMMPFAMEQKMGGRTMMQMVFETVEPNATVDDKIFKMPAKEEKKEEKK